MRRTTPFRSILCPVDFSEQSAQALRHASSVATRSGGRVTVLYVNDPVLLAAVGVQRRSREFLQQTRAELERFVDASVGRSETPRRNASVVTQGEPANEILRTAARLRSELIVMGTHGLSGVSKLFFGSTTEQVLRCAATPVMAVPPAATRDGSGDTRRDMPEIAMVIAPLDLEDKTRDVTGASAIARWYGAELLLVYVLPGTPAPPWLRRAAGEPDDRARSTAGAALERVRATLPRDITAACRVLAGHPADEITRLAATAPASVIAMALRGDDRLFLRRGAIAYRVVSQAVVPVFAMPATPRKRR